MELFRKIDKTQQELEILLQQNKNQLEPFIKVFSLQSHSEYLEVSHTNQQQLIKRIKVYDLLAYTLVPQKELDNLYMLYKGRMKLDLSDHEDLDDFAPRGKYVKKKKNVQYDEVPEGYLIDRQNMGQMFAIENCVLFMLTGSDITWLVLKHEQMKRQKRTFFMNTFKPVSMDEKQFFCQISDSLELYYYKELDNIMKVYDKLNHLFIIFTGKIQIYTKRNVIMECFQSDFLNEECGIANYSAQVLSEDAQVFKIDQQLLSRFPESAKTIIEKSKKHKGQIRRKLVENHIVDLQIPQTFKLQRHHKFRSMISLDKLFTPAQQQPNTQLTVSSGLFKREFASSKKLSTGSLESPDKEVIQILFHKKHFTSNRTLQSQTSDKQNRTQQNFAKLLNMNIQPVQLTKQSKKVQSLCLLPDMAIFQQRKTSQY